MAAADTQFRLFIGIEVLSQGAGAELGPLVGHPLCHVHVQRPAVAEAGFHAIAPDMRGYGDSSCPHPVDAYTLAELPGDLVALLDALEIEKAIFVGHDWGGFVTWAMPVLHPERVAGITCSCTPYMPFPSVAKHEAAVGGETDRQYVAWFQKPGVAEAYMLLDPTPVMNP